MIEPGAPVPSVNVKLVENGDVHDADTAEIFAQGLSALFCVPGAFTPTCSNDHLPGYVEKADQFAALGVDRIICAAANDHHVMKAWSEVKGANGKVAFIADHAAAFAEGLGVATHMSALGHRYKRSAFLIRDGHIVASFSADQPGQLGDTSADAVLAALRSQS
ncbi:MAG: peroxiredoxin [Hyphomicrobiaceae bacterium]|nr:peroxiredoxin [Hyphomicrobiaceae bacterium]